MAYSKTVYVNGGTPAINATNLNKSEIAIECVHKGTHIYSFSSNGTDAYAVTFSTPFTGYTAGMHIRVKVDISNTGASTLKVDALSAVNIKVLTPTGKAATNTGDMIAGGIYDFIYDGTDFILLNPTSILQSLLSSKGGIIYASASNVAAMLALGANGKAIISNGATVIYGYPDQGTYVASNNAILTANTERTTTGTTFTTVKSFTLKKGGSVRLKYQYKCSSGSPNLQVQITDGAGWSQILTNQGGMTSYTAVSVDISVAANKTYYIKIRNDTSTYTNYLNNFSVCADDGTTAVSNSISD